VNSRIKAVGFQCIFDSGIKLINNYKIILIITETNDTGSKTAIKSKTIGWKLSRAGADRPKWHYLQFCATAPLVRPHPLQVKSIPLPPELIQLLTI
jgi:hypothetical protein